MKYYAFEPTRSEKFRNLVQIMYPDAKILNVFPYDDDLCNLLNQDDTLIIFDVLTLCRPKSKDFSFEYYKRLYERGINIIFEKSPNCDSAHLQFLVKNSTDSLELLFLEEVVCYARLLEFERTYKQTSMLLAKNEGKQIGGKKGVKLTTKKSIDAKRIIIENSKDFNGSLDDIELMKYIGIARNTYYKYKKEIKESFNQK